MRVPWLPMLDIEDNEFCIDSGAANVPSFGHLPHSGVVARQRMTPPLFSGLACGS